MALSTASSRSITHLSLIAVLLSMFMFAARPKTVQAAAITVTTTTDELNTDGDCSLREAIRAANLDRAVDQCSAGTGADTIRVPAGAYTLSIAGVDEDAALTGDLDILGELTIEGTEATTTIFDGGYLDRVVDVMGNARVELTAITVRNGSGRLVGCDSSDELDGGGIRNSGTLTVEASAVAANSTNRECGEYITGDGGGIYNSGTLTVEHSFIANNR